MSRRMTSQRRQIIQSLADKEYRELFVEEHIAQGVAFQIRSTRNDRGWTQAELARRLGTGQSRVSSLEDPDGGQPNLTTLINVAHAFDVALMVRFMPFSQLVEYSTSISAVDLAPPGFGDDTALQVTALRTSDSTAGGITGTATTRLVERVQKSSSQLPLAMSDTSGVVAIRRRPATTTRVEDAHLDFQSAAGG